LSTTAVAGADTGDGGPAVRGDTTTAAHEPPRSQAGRRGHRGPATIRPPIRVSQRDDDHGDRTRPAAAAVINGVRAADPAESDGPAVAALADVEPVTPAPNGPVTRRTGRQGYPVSRAVRPVGAPPAAVAAVAAVAAPSVVGGSSLASVLGSFPNGPAESPMAWAVLAATGRGPVRPRALPAAAVSTGQTMVAAAAADPISGFFQALAAFFFNQPPGIRATLADQTGSGVITGVLDTNDPDSAPLTFTVTTKPAHGSVVLAPDGSFTYTADPAVGPTGTTDLFRITVSDAGSGFHIHGLGGLIHLLTFGLIGDPGHSATATVSVTVAPFTDPPPPIDPPASGELSTFCGCTLMPANTVFHANVSTLPVLPKSTTWTTLLGGNLSAIWGGDPWLNSTAGMPVNIAPASLPTETVIFNRGLASSGPTIDDRPYAIPDRPLVEGMPNVPAWDRHLLVFREGVCISQELYNVANGVELPANGVGDALANMIYASQYGSTWLAEAGVQYDMNSMLYPVKGEANASQLPFLPLILRPDDLSRGSIDHMLGIVIAKDRGTGYAWPARAGDGTGTNPDGVPMGTVFRLRADFDVSGYDPATQVVLRALKEHGAVVYDSFGPGQNGARLMAMSNGWTGTSYLTAQRELSTIPMSAFQAVDILTLAVDPAVGWAIHTS
jgi:hypothetical protein